MQLALVSCQALSLCSFVIAGHSHCVYSFQSGPHLFSSLNFSFQRHYNDEDPEKEKRIKELELLLMSTENELKGQQALPVRMSLEGAGAAALSQCCSVFFPFSSK